MPLRFAPTLVALFLLLSCGDARYALRGRVTTDARHLVLMDSSARDRVDTIRAQHADARAALDARTTALLDSLTAEAEAAAKPLREAERRLASAEKDYGAAFQGIKQYRSFGGNPIFTDADQGVRTESLLDEIADRFYKGKAFSLETGRDVRTFIQDRLVPLERRVDQARRLARRRTDDRKGDQRSLADARQEARRMRDALFIRSNERIRDVLFGAERLTVAVDSNRTYVVDGLPPGLHYIYARDPSERLIPVRVEAHSRLDVTDTSGTSPLLADTSQASGP